MAVEDATTLAEFRALTVNALIERVQFMRQAGVTFGGLRDLYEVLGYARVLTVDEYRSRYARGGIAKRIVEALPNATWRGEMELVEDEDPKTDTPFEQAWNDLATRLKIQSVLRRVDILAGLSYYAVLLIGAPGNFDEELPRGTPDKLLYLSPFAGAGVSGARGGFNARDVGTAMSSAFGDATIQELEMDGQSPRFGLPKTYQLRRIDVSSPDLMKPVHWSRVIHIAEGCIDNEVYGQPTLESCWNLLDDLDKVTGGGAEAFWLRANQGTHINVDADAALSNEEKEDLKNQAKAYRDQIQRWIQTRKVEVNQLGSDVANFSNPADAILTQIAGCKSIPKRILTGSEMGELASSQDRDNWKDQINGRQSTYAGPSIVRPLVDRLIAYGYLPTPTKGALAYEVRWPHIQTLTEQEKADGAGKWASVNSTAGFTVFTDAEIRDKWYGMEPTETIIEDKWRVDLAVKMAETNKVQGATIFTDDEIRKTCYGWKPLTPEQKVPIAAPVRVSATAPTPAADAQGNPIAAAPAKPGAAPGAPGVPALKAAEEVDEELVKILEAAIVAGNIEVIDRIIGTRHLGGPGSGWTAEGGHVPGASAGQELKTAGTEDQPRDEQGRWTNAAHKTAADISGVTPADAKLKTFTAYHVTKRENVASILKGGFDINKVKPQWVNDFAVSLNKGEKASAAYFSKTGQELDRKKYALLEVKAKARLHDAGDSGQGPVPNIGLGPRNYREQIIAKGYDGQNLGRMIYLHNEKAIVSIREVVHKMKTAEEDETIQVFSGRQHPRALQSTKFASTQVQLPDDLASVLLALGQAIPDDDLAADGRETDAHITLKYGIHADDPAPIQKLLVGLGPVKLTLGETAVFEGDDYDVLYVEVDSPDLERLNQVISDGVKVTDTHPGYTPHATIAYLKKGLGLKYFGDQFLVDKTATIDAVTFSPAEGEKTVISLL